MGMRWRRRNRRGGRTSTGGRFGAVLADDARWCLGLLLSSRDAFARDLLFFRGLIESMREKIFYTDEHQ
jgi:hypothetical protein